MILHILKIIILALFAIRPLISYFQPTSLLQSARERYLDAFARALRPRKLRTFREFGEEEIVIPDGPFKGRKYRADRMLWHIPILREYDAGRFKKYYLEGSRQSSKTLIGLQLPTMYHLFEEEENVIIGLPNLDLANGIWQEKILPIIENSKYKKYLPDKGLGSKGGKIRHYIRFKNGTTLRFMSEGFTYTCRVVIFTEVYRLKESGAHGKETGAFFQIEKCTEAYGDRARIYAECIVTDGTGHIHKEVEKNTDSRIHMKCPYCGNYIIPDREHFSGWETARSKGEAARSCYYICNHCEEHWSEQDRKEALKDVRLLHTGQSVSPEGRIKGAIPDTDTFGLNWNAMHSMFKSMANIAREEYSVRYDESPQMSEQALCNYVWGIAFSKTPDQGSPISQDIIFGKITNIPYGRVPDHCTHVTVGIDIGEYYHWYVAVAWAQDAQGYIIDYGDIPVHLEGQEGELTGVAILNALRRFRENKLANGWMYKAAMKKPDLVFVDSGYGDYTTEIYQFVHESGQGVYFATKGKGTDPRDPNWSMPKKEKSGVGLGHEWYLAPQNDAGKWRDGTDTYLVFMHTDYWRIQVHERLMASTETSGSLYLYQADPHHHMEFVNHMLAYKRRTILRTTISGSVLQTIMEKSGRPDHLADSLYAALAAADTLGIKIKALHIERPEQPVSPRKKHKKRRRRIRTKY